MKTLDDELDTLSRLSDHRKRAIKLKAEGLAALGRLTSREAARSGRWRMSKNKVEPDEIEMALLTLVQSRDMATQRGGDDDLPFIEGLVGLKLENLFDPSPGALSQGASHYAKEDHESLPVMVATRAMHALIASSKHAFSPASMLCYYRIVRELYSADSPDWSTGGARAGNGGESSAFMTGECVRAISALARAHRQTSIFFGTTYELYQRRVHLDKLSELGRWRDAELERVGLAWYTSTASQLGELTLNLKKRSAPTGRIDTEYVDDYLATLSAELKERIEAAKKSFLDALRQVRAFRREEKREAERFARSEVGKKRRLRRWDERYHRSESAHRMAYSIVRQAVVRANAALKICEEEKSNILGGLKRLSKLFGEIDCDIKRILEPARRFLGASLDRELTAASATGQPVWDARELVFAASSYGSVTGWAQDARLTRACALLGEAISERGVLPPGRPFHSTDSGLSLHVNSFEVARGFAQLLHRTDFEVTPTLAGRMLQLFEDHILSLDEPGTEAAVCWHAEDPPIPKRPTVWTTAVAVLALDRIIRMLDHKINEGVLRHFSALRYDKKGEEGGMRLEDLSFPDYGLSLVSQEVARRLRPEQDRRWSVAITLEQMRAHVLRTTLPAEYPKIFSAVLFGPPGTGKTTLLKALARSSELPLVQLTPSDIARAGEQGIEKSAKQIFDALSMLTRAVIIFDEFEPILLKREPSGQNETRNIFTFLTPGMLPKLTKLYEAAERQGVAYCLVTNHYQKLDEAAIRRGRFDEHIIIYHPDFLARAGMFLDRLRTLEGDTSLRGETQWRFEGVIKSAAGANIEDLVKVWFKVPKKKGVRPEPGTYAYYVLSGGDRPNLGRVRTPGTSDKDQAGSTPLEVWRDEKEEELAEGSIWTVLKEAPASEGSVAKNF